MTCVSVVDACSTLNTVLRMAERSTDVEFYVQKTYSFAAKLLEKWTWISVSMMFNGTRYAYDVRMPAGVILVWSEREL
jgi:hypothetical protein